MIATTSEHSDLGPPAGTNPSDNGKIRVLAPDEHADLGVLEPKRNALVAHDHRKGDLLEWAEYNRDILADHILCATGTTGRLIGALIASGRLDMLIFFWDPMSPQPHDSDVKALVRIAVVWNIPIACNRTSADYLITSPLLGAQGPAREPLAASRG